MPQLFAARIDELRDKIKGHNENITVLEKEIKEYESKIQTTQKEAVGLTKTIESLEITERKLSTDIKVTEVKVNKAELNIERMGIEIETLSGQISFNKEAIAETIRALRHAESNSVIEVMFLHDSFSDFWITIDNLEVLQKNITTRVADLRENKAAIDIAKQEEESYHDELSGLKVKLVGQKQGALVAKKEKNVLLVETKNKQSNYEKILQEKKERKRIFEEELTKAERELKEALNPALLPSTGSGTLSWPLERFIITQYFGNTEFATQNPSVYNGRGHNGIDLAENVGTPILSARDGIVVGSGDTDLACKNASYGKWILVQHDNGLSTLYAHLSLVSSQKGSTVKRGNVIGYLGNTGYSTGPHLHFTVFATDAVEVGSLKSAVCPSNVYIIPLLTKTGGYLNPLSYLPPVPQ